MIDKDSQDSERQLRSNEDVVSWQGLAGSRRLRGEETQDWARNVRCNPLEVAISTRLLAVLLLAGVHIADSLKAVFEQCSDARMVEVWWTIHEAVQEGFPLSQAMAKFPRVFSRLYRTVIKVGETSGSMPFCLNKMADWLEKERKMASSLRASLTYPTFVLTFSGLLSWWLFAQVLPPFLRVLSGMNTTLPLPTRVLVFCVNFAGSVVGWACLFVVCLLAVRLWYWLKRPDVWEKVLGLVYTLPVLGPLLVLSTNIRVAVASAILFRAGCDSISTWKVSFQACDDPHMTRHGEGLIKAVREGRQASDYLAEHPTHFTNIFTQMVRAGEETGRLPEFLERLSPMLEEELDYRISMMVSALEPILMAGVSLIMLGVLLSIFLPLYSHLSTL